MKDRSIHVQALDMMYSRHVRITPRIYEGVIEMSAFLVFLFVFFMRGIPPEHKNMFSSLTGRLLIIVVYQLFMFLMSRLIYPLNHYKLKCVMSA